MNIALMNWSKSHTDKYYYSQEEKSWIKFDCQMRGSTGMDCTAPNTLKRGTQFSYHRTATEHEIDDAMSEMDARLQ